MLVGALGLHNYRKKDRDLDSDTYWKIDKLTTRLSSGYFQQKAFPIIIKDRKYSSMEPWVTEYSEYTVTAHCMKNRKRIFDLNS